MARDRERDALEIDIFCYLLPDGWKILAGKTAADNEQLSCRIVRPNDWWFHVRGMPGSHVILQGPEGENPSKKLLQIAAATAAWHSKARQGGIVPVSGTQGKFIGKPRGAKEGTVSIRKETIFKVRPQIPPEANL